MTKKEKEAQEFQEECQEAFERGIDMGNNFGHKIAESCSENDEYMGPTFEGALQGLLVHLVYFVDKEELKEMIDDTPDPDEQEFIAENNGNTH